MSTTRRRLTPEEEDVRRRWLSDLADMRAALSRAIDGYEEACNSFRTWMQERRRDET